MYNCKIVYYCKRARTRLLPVAHLALVPRHPLSPLMRGQASVTPLALPINRAPDANQQKYPQHFSRLLRRLPAPPTAIVRCNVPTRATYQRGYSSRKPIRGSMSPGVHVPLTAVAEAYEQCGVCTKGQEGGGGGGGGEGGGGGWAELQSRHRCTCIQKF